MGVLNKLIEINLTGLHLKCRFSQSLAQKLDLKKSEQEEKRKGTVPKQSHDGGEQPTEPARAGEPEVVSGRTLKGTEGRGEEARVLHAPFPGLPLLAEPSFLLYLAWTGALRGSRTLWLPVSRAT